MLCCWPYIHSLAHFSNKICICRIKKPVLWLLGLKVAMVVKLITLFIVKDQDDVCCDAVRVSCWEYGNMRLHKSDPG